MKINNLYICVVMLLFTTMGYAIDFDEYGGGGDMTGQYGPNGTVGYDYTYGAGNFGFSNAIQNQINYNMNIASAIPQNSYSYNYISERYTGIYRLSPTDRNLYVPSPKDLLVPWQKDAAGQQWYTLYKGYDPGYLDIKVTTTLASEAKSSIGYHFETTYSENGANNSSMNSFGGINLGGINSSTVTTTIPPVFFTPASSTNLSDKLSLGGGDFRTLIGNFMASPYYSVRETPYVYIDSNDNTRLGYLTIIRNTNTGVTSQYFWNDGDYDIYYKLPQINGIEIHAGGNISTGYGYNAGGVVTVRTWDGTNNQPDLHLPGAVILIDKANGPHLIVVPQVRPASSQSVHPPTAYYNAIPRIERVNVNYGSGSNRENAEIMFQNSSLTPDQALFVKREYFDVSIPDLKGGIDVFMNDLINKTSNGLADEFKNSAEEILIRYATANLVALNANLVTTDTTDPKQKVNFSTMTNVSNVLANKTWISYWNILNCNDAARAQNAQSGLSNTNPAAAGLQANTFIDKKRQIESTKTTTEIDMQKAVDIVIKNLKIGKPVMAGVMYERKSGADHITGGTQGDNNNVATNHYITIVGMGIDNTKPYFSYYDNFVDPYLPDGTTRKSDSAMLLYATDTLANRIYYYKDSVGNYFFADRSATTIDGSHGSNLEYILTEIRDNY
jgi:hypothetical protein